MYKENYLITTKNNNWPDTLELAIFYFKKKKISKDVNTHKFTVIRLMRNRIEATNYEPLAIFSYKRIKDGLTYGEYREKKQISDFKAFFIKRKIKNFDKSISMIEQFYL